MGSQQIAYGNISRRAHVACPGVLRTPICVYEIRSSRQPDRIELAKITEQFLLLHVPHEEEFIFQLFIECKNSYVVL